MRDRLSSAGHKILFVSSLNIRTKCLLRWFASASECEKMSLNKIIHWTIIIIMCRFPGPRFILFTHNSVEYF